MKVTALLICAITAAHATVVNEPKVDDGVDKYFKKQYSSFGVPVYGTKGAKDAALEHAACVMDIYLDQDRDGVADDAAVLQALLDSKAAIVVPEDEEEIDRIEKKKGFTKVFNQHADTEPDKPGIPFQEVYDYEMATFTCPSWTRCGVPYQEVFGVPPGIPGLEPYMYQRGYFDTALEEVLHLITEHGYANAYPEQFGLYAGTTLAAAIDEAIGDCDIVQDCAKDHDFSGCKDFTDDGFVPGSCSGGFHYSDTSCGYEECLLTEGLYWGLTSLLGGQEGRCHWSSPIPPKPGKAIRYPSAGWEMCTEASMRERAPKLTALAETMGITKLPDGESCDKANWHKKGKSSKNCAWVSSSPDDRCSARGDDGSLASESCPDACRGAATTSMHALENGPENVVAVKVPTLVAVVLIAGVALGAVATMLLKPSTPVADEAKPLLKDDLAAP